MTPGLELAREYLLDPEAYWPEGQTRQVAKLRRRLEAAAAEAGSSEAAVDLAVERAHERVGGVGPPIYIANCGSSGSHWLDAMLAFSPDVLAGGEIYLPPALVQRLQELGPEEAEPAVDAIYLVHALFTRRRTASPTARVTNSAHIAGTRLSSLTRATRILLIRDPLDIALSRTFRKDEYRQHVEPDASDDAYLARNCEFVVRFYEQALAEEYDLVVRYEDLVADAEVEIARVLAQLGLGTETATAAAEATAAERQGGGAGGRERVGTNLFVGERREIDPRHRAAAEVELASIRGRLGYSTG